MSEETFPSAVQLCVRVTGPPFGRESALLARQAMIAEDPDALPPRFAYACALEDLGRKLAAEKAYRDVLNLEPAHVGALNNIGVLLYGAGAPEFARAFFAKAVTEHPDDPVAFVNLGNIFVDEGDFARARAAYERALEIKPEFTNAYFALACLADRLGDAEESLRNRQLAFARPIVSVDAYNGTGTPIRMLILTSANGGNLVTNMLLDDRQLERYSVVVEGFKPGMMLPQYDVVLNAIGDADRSAKALQFAAAILAGSPVRVLNPPERVLATGRSEIAATLGGIAGLRTAQTDLLPRSAVTPEELERRGFRFPLLLRSPGYHTGQHFEMVETPGELAARAAALPGPALLAIAFLDARGADGAFRKYRVMFVDGRCYPLHLAISARWKIHYFSADMHLDPAHRAEEARFLADMAGTLGPRATAALEQIAARLGLDYGGIDFALDADGSVLLFETNATMAVYPPPAEEHFAYRRPAVDAIVTAVREMFARAAQRRASAANDPS